MIHTDSWALSNRADQESRHVAFTAIAIGLMVGGMVMDYYGKKKAANAAAKAATETGRIQQKAADAGAGLQDYNAAVADLQAEDAITRGADQESRFRSQVRGAIGQQRAGIAGGNIDVGFGSAVDVQADAAFLGELDSLQIRTNAQREAWGFKVQAEDLRTRAKIARQEGTYLEAAGRTTASGIQSAANWQAASSIVGGAGSLFQTAYGFQKKA